MDISKTLRELNNKFSQKHHHNQLNRRMSDNSYYQQIDRFLIPYTETTQEHSAALTEEEFKSIMMTTRQFDISNRRVSLTDKPRELLSPQMLTKMSGAPEELEFTSGTMEASEFHKPSLNRKTENNLLGATCSSYPCQEFTSPQDTQTS